MDELMLKIENVRKIYKLGQIGGTSLREELQRKWAKIRKKEDPTQIIGKKKINYGEKFLALDGVSFEVKKGERIGIIGHNGAGKSTLLKLISRITAPTEGAICLNGRVASMLEVGTGFHGELTGRENVYMNGAILGMTKKEIDKKMDDIIEFSEVRQFIDTPVKRYSSGMYVKLAFSVAAHLDSEIMIMDEVLAVGDMAFQKKCLNKMNQVSKEQGRTILYVSHNMNTIRELCNRVIVLDHGKVVFDGGVEEGINIYMKTDAKTLLVDYDLRNFQRHSYDLATRLMMTRLTFLNKEINRYIKGEKIFLQIEWTALDDLEEVGFSCGFKFSYGNGVALLSIDKYIKPTKGKNYKTNLVVDISCFEYGVYVMEIIAHERGALGIKSLDKIHSIQIEIVESDRNEYYWHNEWWGHFHLFNVGLLDNKVIK